MKKKESIWNKVFWSMVLISLGGLLFYFIHNPKGSMAWFINRFLPFMIVLCVVNQISYLCKRKKEASLPPKKQGANDSKINIPQGDIK